MKRFFARRNRRFLVTALAAALGSSLLVAGPVHASHANEGAYGTSFVDGAGALTDDFGDHYGELGNSLCYGCGDSWNTDLVIMWQTILFSEGLIGGWDIDGQFGAQTRDATRAWQRRYGLDDDGLVGNATWSKADQFLYWTNNGWVAKYVGVNGGYVNFRRGNSAYGEGAYQFVGAAYGSTTIYFTSPDHRINFFKKTITVNPY